jgi:uncharacterized protein YuzE
MVPELNRWLRVVTLEDEETVHIGVSGSGFCAMTQLNSPVFYDRSTDTMYVTFREGRVAHTVAHDERDFAVDIGDDGQPVGYEIQFASKHSDVIAEALQILQRGNQIAAE